MMIKVKHKKSTKSTLEKTQSFIKNNFYDTKQDWLHGKKIRKEQYFSNPTSVLLAYKDKKIIGCMYLFKRVCRLGGRQIWLDPIKSFFYPPIILLGGEKINTGGFGSLCTHKKYRNKGIGTKMLKKGKIILKKWNCEICFICTDVKKLGAFYKKIGFKELKGIYIFFGKSGKKYYEGGGMLAPVVSKIIYDKVMTSKKRLYVGYGNW